MRALLRAGRGELLGLNLSVVIPALNAGRTLGACLERVKGAAEIIVVDGGSGDETCMIAAAHGARLISAPRGRGVQLRILDADAVTSTERWERDGWLRRSARNLICLGLYGAGVSPERIARLYG